MKILRASALLACLSCVGAAAPAHAGDVLTLGRALERAVSANPLLAAHAADTEAAHARAEREALPPQLILGADVENVAGSGEMRGFDAAESTVQLTRTLELGGKRAGRRALGDAEVALAGHAQATAGLDLRSLITRRFVEVVADQDRLALAAERVELAARTRAEVARVVERARNPETDLRAAEIALADAELEHEHAEHELRAARVTLASIWGERRPVFDRAVLAFDSLPEPESFDDLAARLPASATLSALKLEAESASARERLALSQRRPDLLLSLGVRRLESLGEQGLVMGFSMPLGTGSRAKLALSESRAHGRAISLRREAIEAEAFQQLFEHYQELGHARTEFQALDESMIPKAEQALTLANRGFELGRFPLITLTQAQERLFDLRRRRIDAAARYHILLADMQRLVAAVETP
jgi:cobalt-zinc-cadmium efflux system outer membrane protein